MTKTPLKIPERQSGRLDLANWIASKDNPLTARVMANRVWLHLFGRGLVPTADNFGAAGQPPTHPELLDHLARLFMENGWSVKKLIKRVVMSHAYQLDSKNDATNYEVDPDNALVWRMTPAPARRRGDARLDAGGERAARREAAGRVGGGAGGRGSGGRAAAVRRRARRGRRSTTRGTRTAPCICRSSATTCPKRWRCSTPPDPSLIVADRPTTTVPAQGLFLLNNPFVIRSAEAAADKLLKATTTDTERVRQAYLAFYGRPPNEKELANAEKFLAAYTGQLAKDRVPAIRRERETWAAFCQALFASAEFQYRK